MSGRSRDGSAFWLVVSVLVVVILTASAYEVFFHNRVTRIPGTVPNAIPTVVPQ